MFDLFSLKILHMFNQLPMLNLSPLLFSIRNHSYMLFTLIVSFDPNFTSGNVVGLIFFQHLDRLTVPTFSNLRTGYRLFMVFSISYIRRHVFLSMERSSNLRYNCFQVHYFNHSFHTGIMVIVVLIRSRYHI